MKWQLRIGLLIFYVLVLEACSEGGIGGTGGFAPPPPDGDPVQLSGVAQKGPYSAGATIRVKGIGASGDLGAQLVEAVTQNHMGEFAFDLDAPGTVLVEVSGAHLSEHLGTAETFDTQLSAVVSATESRSANVNVLTHLIAARVRALMAQMSVEAAQLMAEDELLLALNELLPGMDSTAPFEALSILNTGATDAGLKRGNGYLLALSALLDRTAITRATGNGSTPAFELNALLAAMTDDLADDGVIADAQLLADLDAAMSSVDPIEVYLNLLTLPDFQQEYLSIIQGAGAFSVDSLTVSLSGETLKLVNTNNDNFVESPVHDLVADLDLFIDSDGDGQVNADDEDDDNDGIPDGDDPDPYGD